MALVLAAHQVFGFRPSPVLKAVVLLASLVSAGGALLILINSAGARRSKRWKAAVAGGAIVAVVLVLIVVYATGSTPATAVEPIGGNLRIAVAPFEHAVEGEPDGRPNEATEALARRFSDRLRDELTAVAEPFRPGVGYRELSIGARSDRRDLEAAADSVDAHVVVFGRVETDTEARRASLQALVYVSPLAVPRALEVAGTYPLGAAIEVPGDLLGGDPIVEQRMESELEDRVAGLAELARSVLLLGSGEYDAADDALAALARDPSPSNRDLVTFLRGVVALQRRDFNGAAAMFRSVADADPTNGRALLGSAEVELQRVLPGGDECRAAVISAEELGELAAMYRRGSRGRRPARFVRRRAKHRGGGPSPPPPGRRSQRCRGPAHSGRRAARD